MGDVRRGERASSQGFAWVRLMAALWVVFCHSAPLTGKPVMYPGWTFVPEHMGLTAFFVLSGYQISGSWARDPSAARFLVKRVLRIWPPLIFLSLITVLVVGPLVTIWPTSYYFGAADTWGYVINNATVFNLQHTLPGVFDYNVYPWSVNGSIWTLPMELLGYVLVLILGVTRPRKRWPFVTVVIVIAFIAADQWLRALGAEAVGSVLSVPIASTVQFLVAYAIGVMLYAYRDRIPLSPKVAIVVFAVQLVLNATVAGPVLNTITISYCALTLAACWPRRLLIKNKARVSCSYGVYLYGFLIQQILVYLGVESEWTLAALALPLAYVAGLASWKLIEEPTMRLRDLLRRPSRSAATAG